MTQMSDVAICDIFIPVRYVRQILDTSTLSSESGLVRLKRTPDSQKLISEIENACQEWDPENTLFTFGGQERLGTVDISEDDAKAEYVISLLVT